MPYILKGTKNLISYWNILGQPCEQGKMAEAIKQPREAFIGSGRDQESFTCQYGETEAQNLAAVLGTTITNVSASGGQILI